MVHSNDPAHRSTQSPFSAASPTRLIPGAKVSHTSTGEAAQALEKDQVLAAALSEYCQLKEDGAAPDVHEFCRRYPTYHKSIQRMIDVEETLDKLDDFDDVQWPEVGSSFMGFDVLHELGVGAFARVYLASEPALGGRLVAVKVAMFGSDEAETLGKLLHPNVVPVHSVRDDVESGMTAVCMPYLGSATLADVIEQVFQDGVPRQGATILAAVASREVVGQTSSGPAAEEPDPTLRQGRYVDAVVKLGIQMAEALAYTHARGVLHRDLKPSNVLITPAGQPKLLDFNLSCDVETEVNRLGGTLPYMPPEQIEDVFLRPYDAQPPTDPRSDLFSLGVILYELFTGQLPFGNPRSTVQTAEAGKAYLQAQQAPPRNLRELNPAVEPRLARLIEACIAVDPERRPRDAACLAAELRNHFSFGKRVTRWSASHRKHLLALGTVIVGLALALTWHLGTRPSPDRRAYNRGLRAMENEEYFEAIECFDEALRLNEKQAAIRFARGLCHRARDDYMLALHDLQPLIMEDDCDPIVKEVYGYACLEAGGTTMTRATIPYRSLLDARPHDRDLQVNLALANFGFTYGEGRIKRGPRVALARANEILERDPQCAAAHHIRAMCTYEMFISDKPVDVVDVLQDVETAIALGQRSADLEKSRMRLLAKIAEGDPVLHQELVKEMRNRLRRIAPLFQKESLERLTSSLRLVDDPAWFATVTAHCRETPELRPVAVIAAPPDQRAVQQYLERPWQ